jgi:hypothetical protein
LIEDVAEALGSQYHDQYAGTFGDISTFRDILQFEVYPDTGKAKNTAALFSTISPDEEILKLKK